MFDSNDIEVKFNTKELPLEYKLLEWRLILNRELYEEKVIDLKVFSSMESSLLSRMRKIRTEVMSKRDDLTTSKSDGNMASSH